MNDTINEPVEQEQSLQTPVENTVAAKESSEIQPEVASQDAEDGLPDDWEPTSMSIPTGTSAWALAMLASGVRVMRAAWVDNHHLDPDHIRAGIKLSFDDIVADDWKAI